MKLYNEELIKKWEQLRLEAYLPTPHDVWTIGWGHTKDVRKGMTISIEEAQAFFEADIKWAEDAVNQSVKVGLTQNQFDALVSLVFNIGETQWLRSTCLRRLNAGNYEGAAEALTWFNKQNKKVLRGLVRRRAEEMEIFLSPDDKIEKSVVPDVVEDMKPLPLSKEVVAGVSALLVGGGGFLGGLGSESQLVIASTLSVLLLSFGGFILWNRIRARNKGER